LSSRTIIIGDVYGCLDELNRLFDDLDFSDSDRLIFVGDLINKGPNSKGVVDRVRELNAECVKGNHELRFIEYVRNNEKGRDKWDLIKEQCGKELNSVVDWLDTLPMYIDDPEFLIVHAGLAPGKAPNQTTNHILANIRTWDGIGADLNRASNPAWHMLYKEEKLVVYGHWAMQGLCVKQNTIGLDSGCVYGNELSALVLPDRRIVQVKAAKVYCEII